MLQIYTWSESRYESSLGTRFIAFIADVNSTLTTCLSFHFVEIFQKIANFPN